jgi:hypothetical protein
MLFCMSQIHNHFEQSRRHFYNNGSDMTYPVLPDTGSAIFQ